MHPDFAYISTTIKGARATMTKKERFLAQECFDHYRGEFTRIGSSSPDRVAHTIHSLVDERMQDMLTTSPNGKQVTCSKGCAACCHLHVDVFPQEAVLLRQFTQWMGITIDEARLARQASKNSNTWRELAPEDRACVFLGEDRTCRVYEHRPGACRKYVVKSAPALCDMDKHPGGKVGIVFSLHAELVHSAAMTAYGAGSMAEMLLRELMAEPEKRNPST